MAGLFSCAWLASFVSFPSMARSSSGRRIHSGASGKARGSLSAITRLNLPAMQSHQVPRWSRGKGRREKKVKRKEKADAFEAKSNVKQGKGGAEEKKKKVEAGRTSKTMAWMPQ